MLAFLVSAMVVILNFSLPVMNGSQGEAYDFSIGKVRVIEAYFNACPYCDQNASNVDDLATDFEENLAVEVIDVGTDKKTSDYQSWIKKHNPNHPVLMDSNKKLIGQLGTTSYPSTYVIDRSGNVVFKSVGVWSQLTKERLRNAVEQALEAKD